MKLPITLPQAEGGMFEMPRLVFTWDRACNPKSALVVEELERLKTGEKKHELECRVFESEADVRSFLEGGISSRSAVFVSDQGSLGRRFRYFAHGRELYAWHVAVSSGLNPGREMDVAQQIRASFYVHFKARLSGDYRPRRAGAHFKAPAAWAPWGPLPGGAGSLRMIDCGDMSVLSRLNSPEAPNLAAVISTSELALELPEGSKISWVRVVPKAAKIERKAITAVTEAFRELERAGSTLVQTDPRVEGELACGVDIKDRDLLGWYLRPAASEFSVRRPDLHISPEGGLGASENDEMPGGLPDLFHLSRSYGVAEDSWKRFWDGLFGHGPVLFTVSHQWSGCYVAEMRWLVGTLQDLGYEASLVTTDDLSEIAFDSDRLLFKGKRIRTVWRQFPVFEAELFPKIKEMVRLSQEWKLRMVPEFAHFGNKTWFYLFWKHHDFFARTLTGGSLAILDSVIPRSALVSSAQSFPFSVNGSRVTDLDSLRSLPADERDHLVLKVTGAGTKAARSYGVLMGHGLGDALWRGWIDERVALKQPFLVQECFKTAVVPIPVRHTKLRSDQVFNCRMLLRPWQFGDEVVAASICAVPHTTKRVHGMVDMAMIPVEFS